MRTNLKELYSDVDRIHTWTGIFSHLSYEHDSTLIKHLRWEDKYVEHSWVQRQEVFKVLNLKRGDRIQFNAIISPYLKSNGELDYGFSFISHVSLLERYEDKIKKREEEKERDYHELLNRLIKNRGEYFKEINKHG